jgi:hypothetical protein
VGLEFYFYLKIFFFKRLVGALEFLSKGGVRIHPPGGLVLQSRHSPVTQSFTFRISRSFDRFLRGIDYCLVLLSLKMTDYGIADLPTSPSWSIKEKFFVKCIHGHGKHILIKYIISWIQEYNQVTTGLLLATWPRRDVDCWSSALGILM